MGSSRRKREALTPLAIRPHDDPVAPPDPVAGPRVDDDDEREPEPAESTQASGDSPSSSPTAEGARVEVRSAEEIVAALDPDVVGQAAAKRQVALLVAMHEFGTRTDAAVSVPNAILAGPSGCGKTHTLRAVARALKVPCAIADATAMVTAGVVGIQPEDVIADLVAAANGSLERAARGVIVIDEFDKLASQGGDRDALDLRNVQRHLLKLTEKGRLRVGVKHHNSDPDRYLDTSRVLIVAAGSFASFGGPGSTGADPARLTPAALIAGGFVPELVGRFPIVIGFDPLTSDDLAAILVHEHMSPFAAWRAYFDAVLDAELRIEPAATRQIADQAARIGLGARSLESVVFPIVARKAAGTTRGSSRTVVTIDVADIADGLAPFVAAVGTASGRPN